MSASVSRAGTAKTDDMSSLGQELPVDIDTDTDDEDVPDPSDDKPKKQQQEFEMIVDGFKCPDEYVTTLTPMEFEEMVKMFKEFDTDGSGTIDKVILQYFLFSILIFLSVLFSMKSERFY